MDFTQPTTEARLAEILAAERADTVVHLAFLASPSHATAWAHELESVGTMHVLVAARHAQIRKFVMWSQTLLYGAHPSNPNFLSERHPLRAAKREPFFADKIERRERGGPLRAARAGIASSRSSGWRPSSAPRCTTTSRATSRAGSFRP